MSRRGRNRNKHRFAVKPMTGKRWSAVVALLCAGVAIGTSCMLINPASTQQQKTFCGLEEHKAHTEDCYEKVLVCQQSEEGHIHSDACYSAEVVLICGLEETEGHRHTDECYETEKCLICEDTDEEHVHTDECYEERKTLTCELEEQEPHQHGESCYEARNVLTCGQEESEPHQHTEACYAVDPDLLTCELPVHEHTLQCFSDPEADVETETVWKKTFADVELTGNWSEDVLAIARTQLGYTASSANYRVQEDGVTMKGYTRYGAWYGLPYDDWCAMFCSFCMNYAEIDREQIPYAASCQSWVESLQGHTSSLYHRVHNEVFPDGTKVFADEEAGYVPTPGDLIFYDWESYDPEHTEKRKADHVGFVEEVIFDEATGEPVQLKTIEGNSTGSSVCRGTVDFTEDAILGYARMPENPNFEKQTIESQPAADGAVAVITGKLPEGAEAVIEAVTLTGEELTDYVGETQAAMLKSYVAYDIKILVDGAEWQPDNTVSVVVRQTELTAEENETFAVAHVDGETSEVSDVTGEISGDGEISFTTDGFSLYIFYTVDFHYDGLTFSIEGEESILLSDLFTALGITESASDVAGVGFTDYTLLSVEALDGDWLLTSLAPFDTEETLTITFADGSTLVILVTDKPGGGGGGGDDGGGGGGGSSSYTRPTPPAGVVNAGANVWQIVAEGFTDNTLDDKVPYNGGSSNPEVYVQKNVVPTAKENEFLVYLSVSKPASLEDWLRNASFSILENKNPNFSFQSGSPGKGPMYRPEDLPDDADGLNLKHLTVNIYDTVTFDNQGNITAVGTLLSSFPLQRYTAVSSCSNGSIYVLIPEANGYIKVARGINLHEDEGGTGNPFVINISLEEIASNIGLELRSTVFDLVTDQLGSNMEYVLDDSGSPVVYSSGHAEVDDDGVTLIWEPAESPNTEKVYPSTNPLKCILNNNAELVYRVRLKTETEGFLSCADSSTTNGLSPLPTTEQARSGNFNASAYNAYGTNSYATLQYHKQPMTGGSGSTDSPKSTNFPIPYVRGLLYDLRLKKVTTAGEGLPGAVFRMLDENSSPIVDSLGHDITFPSNDTGLVNILGLTVLPKYIEEVEAPLGYSLPANPVFGPLVMNYTQDKTKFTPETLTGYTDNMRSKEKDSGTNLWQITNAPKPGQKVRFLKVDAETEEPIAGIGFALYGADGSGNMNAEPLSGYTNMLSGTGGLFPDAPLTMPYGTYYLQEVAGLPAYVALTEPIKITVTAGGVTASGSIEGLSVTASGGIYTVTVPNERFYEAVDIKLKKIDAGGDFMGLAGAEFDLYSELEAAETGSITYTDGNSVAHYLMKMNSSSLVSAQDTALTVSGVNAGRYYLFETRAPDGYIPLVQPVIFDVDPANGGAITLTAGEANAVVDESDALLLKVKNVSGYELPETGGPGTILYTLSGLALMAAAWMYGCMMRRKRERRSE